MYANVAIALVCLSIVTAIVYPATGTRTTIHEAKVEIGSTYSANYQADQYYRYRNLAIQAGYASGLVNGVLSNATIGFTPTTTISAGNRISGGVLYVWAVLGSASHTDVNRRLGGAATFGLNQSGNFINSDLGNLGTVIPAFVPNNASVTRVQLN